MEIRHVPQKSLKAKNEIHPSCHTESRLFVHGKDLLKIYNEKPGRNKVNTISRLSLIQNDGIVSPLYGVSLYNTKNINGYGMKYYKDFITLRSYLDKQSISFEERRYIAHKLCQIYDFLLENDFCFCDIHGENIIIKGEEIKFLDMDGGLFSSDVTPEEYHKMIYISKKYLAELCLQVLLSTTQIISMCNKDTKIHLLKRANSVQRKFLLHIFEYNMDKDFNPKDYIDEFSESYIRTERRLLKI